MACITPPALDDAQLLAYLDGEAGQDVDDHVAKCPYCRDRARRLADFQGRLTAALFRVTCPAPEELGEYHLGMLSDDRATVVAQHLKECRHCRQEVAQLNAYLTELAPELELGVLERAKERVRVLVARLVEGGGGAAGGMPAPVPAGIRGEEEGPLVYQAGDVEVMLEVQADAEQPGHRAILGLITGLEDTAGFETHVWQADELVTTVPVDELGNFVVSGLAPATYDLIVSRPDVEVHIQDLEVGV